MRTLRRKRRGDSEYSPNETPTKRARLSPSPRPDAELASPSSTALEEVDLVEAESVPIEEVETMAVAPPTRGRGRGRGRGGRVGRGGRPALLKPNFESRPASPKGNRPFAGRVKKSSDARTQSLRTRKQVLRLHYRQMARVLRGGLLEMVDKSIDQLKDNPQVHASVPEHAIVREALNMKYREVLANSNAQRDMEKRYLCERKAREDEYINKQHQVSQV